MIVELAEAKSYLRVSYDKDNDLIQLQIQAAEEYIKNGTGKVFDNTNPLARLLCLYLVKEMYDIRTLTIPKSEDIGFVVGGIILQLKYCYDTETTE